MLRQTLVDESEVRVDEFQNAAILLHHRFEEQLCLLDHRRSQFSTSARAFGSFSIRRTCASRWPFLRSSPFSATWSNSSSGMLVHRKYDKRVASSKSFTG